MALSKIDMSKMVTGTLPVGSGGTGLTSGTTDQLLKFTGSTTLASSAISTGKIGQVVFNQGTVSGSHIVTTSTSFAGTGINQGITCSATSSKVLIEVYTSMMASSTDDDVRLAIYRTSPGSATNLSNSTYGAGQFRIEAGTGGTNYSSGTFSFIHAPSSTTTQIYEVYMRSGSGAQAYFCQVNGMYRLTCKEILA
jgi:hypothetical protein